ncbi:unnamed protein product [Phyllotreta striolata]|uniref:C2H2-type domain-containing protein n=1 Tax=Phyllotreta striolata TaxID=444603 RepID=A0A9N9TXP2_PHYSR|nr:unnamed protein product [Phyllotreta striolata]
MLADYEEDAHFCIKCHVTVIGLDNYINHRKTECLKNLNETPKSPLPSQLLPPDESFNLKADDFFSSLELRSSSKKSEVQSTSGKNFSGILTRSKTTAVIQANAIKDPEPQQSKSGKNVWIGGHQLKELGYGDNQSKLITAVNNLERRKEEPQRLQVYDDSDDDSDEYDYDVDDSSSDDQDRPPRNHTGGKWKPSSPIQWTKNDWHVPPPNFTGGKWKPKRPSTPTRGKCKETDVPPPSFTGSKWVASKKHDSDVPPPTHTKGKWKPKGTEEDELPPSYTKGKFKAKTDNQYPTGGKGKWKPPENLDEDDPPPNYTKGKWKPRSDEDQYSTGGKVKWKPQIFPPPTHTKGKWKPRTENEDEAPAANYPKDKMKPKALPSTSKQSQEKPEGKWLAKKLCPSEETNKKITDNSLLRKSSGTVQYWCSPCNRRLASKIVYERHLKSELHFKRTSKDREFDESDELTLFSQTGRTKPPEHIFSNQDAEATKRKRIRKKRFEKCEVCHSKVKKFMIGKHLISHYHCRKGDIKSDVAKKMVLENIHGVVLESPFQCSICKFYCNTQEDFLHHWLSPEHVNRQAPGYFLCILCKYQSFDSEQMHKHLISSEHMEVVMVINRSVPIVIKKISPIRCSVCGQEFLLNIQLLSHCRKFGHDITQTQTFLNTHVCNVCGLGLLSDESLRRHKKMVHKHKYYICSICNLKFDNITEAKLHRTTLEHKYTSKRKRNGAGPLKKCQYCDAGFSNFLLLKEHLKSVHPEEKSRCPHCGETFTVAQELTNHLRLKLCKFEAPLEAPESILQCERCPFFSSSVSELLFHLALHEEPQTIVQEPTTSTRMKMMVKFKCPVCEKLFPKGSLQGHIRQHTEERPFECEICGKSFARKNNLQYHVRNHEKSEKAKVKSVAAEQSFLCYICGANFKKRAILQQHMQIHTGKLCKCPHQGCIFVGRKMAELKEHFLIHLDEKNFACNTCDYKGKTKSCLIRHMTMHKETKKLNCPQCLFTTRNPQHLKRHLRTHTGAKPYSCPHCDYKCSNLENLRKHVISTNKHVGKYLYECRFCEELASPFQTNFAKEFKAHLVTEHSDMFANNTDATSYIAGIYDGQDDTKHVFVEQHNCSEMDQSLAPAEEPNENILVLNTDADPIVCQADVSATSKEIENLQDSWSLVGRYDVEEASGTLIPFESDSESLFQEHF